MPPASTGWSLSATFAVLALAACTTSGPAPLSDAPPGLRVAEAALSGGAPEVALSMLDGIVAREPSNRAAIVRQGDAYLALNRTEAAMASYRRALALDPTDPDALLGLGRLQIPADPAAAQASFLGVLARRPADAAALNDLGITEDRQGQHDQAQAHYRAAISLAPNMTAAQANLGLSLALSGHAAEAVGILRPLAENGSATPRVRQNYAAALVLAGQRAEGERVLRRDLSTDEARSFADGFVAIGAGAASP